MNIQKAHEIKNNTKTNISVLTKIRELSFFFKSSREQMKNETKDNEYVSSFLFTLEEKKKKELELSKRVTRPKQGLAT